MSRKAQGLWGQVNRKLRQVGLAQGGIDFSLQRGFGRALPEKADPPLQWAVPRRKEKGVLLLEHST